MTSLRLTVISNQIQDGHHLLHTAYLNDNQCLSICSTTFQLNISNESGNSGLKCINVSHLGSRLYVVGLSMERCSAQAYTCDWWMSVLSAEK
jgi:hypothetical protein